MSRLQDYDPTVIEVAARRLYEKATASLLASIVVGASLGAIFGAVPLTPLGSAWPIPSAFGPATMLLGALCGTAIGYVIGDNRAFRHRLQAQAMLTDLQRELNTAATVEALREIVAQLAEQFERDRDVREAAPQPAPAPAPVVPTPQPVPEPEPAPPAVLLTAPPASPEPAPHVFALPEPAALKPTPSFSLPEPAVSEGVAFPAFEPAVPAAPEPEPEPEPETPPSSAPDLFPPVSADAF